MNRCYLLGNIGKDPELKTFEGGGKVANFSLATTKKWKDKQSGETKTKTTWHNVQASGAKADIVMGYLTKGSKILIEGEIDNRQFEKEGKKQTFSSVNMLSFEFCDKKSDSKESEAPSEPSNDMDIPF